MSETLKKILYVEDDQDIAEITTMTLECLANFEVKHVPSGREVLNTFFDYKPQLILMDVMMPEMDGIETFKELQKNPQTKNTPVIFITAKAQVHEQQAYRQMGVAGVIVKPFDPNTLCTTIESIWKQHK